jgi:hypothetical protein
MIPPSVAFWYVVVVASLAAMVYGYIARIPEPALFSLITLAAAMGMLL